MAQTNKKIVISLSEYKYQNLQHWAQTNGETIAEVIKELIDEYITQCTSFAALEEIKKDIEKWQPFIEKEK